MCSVITARLERTIVPNNIFTAIHFCFVQRSLHPGRKSSKSSTMSSAFAMISLLLVIEYNLVNLADMMEVRTPGDDA